MAGFPLVVVVVGRRFNQRGKLHTVLYDQWLLWFVVTLTHLPAIGWEASISRLQSASWEYRLLIWSRQLLGNIKWLIEAQLFRIDITTCKMHNLVLCLTFCPEKFVWNGGKISWDERLRTHMHVQFNTDVKLETSDTDTYLSKKEGNGTCICFFGVSISTPTIWYRVLMFYN